MKRSEIRAALTDELDEIAALSHPLTDPGDLDPLMDRIGDATIVLLGEAIPDVTAVFWLPAVRSGSDPSTDAEQGDRP